MTAPTTPTSCCPRGQSHLFVWMLAVAVLGVWMTVARILIDHFNPPAPEPTHAAPKTPGVHLDEEQ